MEEYKSKIEKMLLRPREVAEATGYSRSKTYALIASGDIPSMKVGRSLRVPVDALRQWISQQTQAKPPG